MGRNNGERLIPAMGRLVVNLELLSLLIPWTRPREQGKRRTRDRGFQKKKRQDNCSVTYLHKKECREKNNRKEFRGSSGGKSSACESLLYSKWRMDVIGQLRQSGSAACFHRALNYASLSFHQPHTGWQIKNASVEVLPSRLSRRWEDKSWASRFVTRSSTQ